VAHALENGTSSWSEVFVSPFYLFTRKCKEQPLPEYDRNCYGRVNAEARNTPIKPWFVRLGVK